MGKLARLVDIPWVVSIESVQRHEQLWQGETQRAQCHHQQHTSFGKPYLTHEDEQSNIEHGLRHPRDNNSRSQSVLSLLVFAVNVRYRYLLKPVVGRERLQESEIVRTQSSIILFIRFET
jgi:hypothetical protein